MKNAYNSYGLIYNPVDRIFGQNENNPKFRINFAGV